MTLAQARCLLARVRAMEGHFTKSLAAIESYESPDARRGLDSQTDIQLRVPPTEGDPVYAVIARVLSA